MHHAAPEPEERLFRVAIQLELLDGVADRLLGQAVLQLEGAIGSLFRNRPRSSARRVSSRL
jgi:hypothetical protein